MRPSDTHNEIADCFEADSLVTTYAVIRLTEDEVAERFVCTECNRRVDTVEDVETGEHIRHEAVPDTRTYTKYDECVVCDTNIADVHPDDPPVCSTSCLQVFFGNVPKA